MENNFWSENGFQEITAENSTEMITRARTRLMGTLEGPTDRNMKTTSDVTLNLEVVDRNQTKVRARGPVARQDMMVGSKEKPTTRVPKTRTVITPDDASDGSQFDEDQKLSEIESDDESQAEIERLKKQLAKLKVNQESRKQTNQSQLKSGDGSHGDRLPEGLIRWKVEVSGLTMVALIWTLSWFGLSRVADILVGPSRTRYFI